MLYHDDDDVEDEEDEEDVDNGCELCAKIMTCGIMMRRRMVLMIVVNCLLLRGKADYKSQLRT